MINASGLSFTPNERWITDVISVRGPMMMFETTECAYQDVYKVDAGRFVQITLSKKNKVTATYHTYYNPISKTKLQKKYNRQNLSGKIS